MGKKSIAEYNRTFQNVTDIIGKAVASLPPVTSYSRSSLSGGGGGATGGSGVNCGNANSSNVNTIYPRSVKWQRGPQPVIAPIEQSPTVTINLRTQQEVPFVTTIVTYQEYIVAAEAMIDKMIPSQPKNIKKLILTAALATAIKEQGSGGKIKGFNNNLTGVESSGFKVFTSSDVNGKVKATEGGTGRIKSYYSFSSIKSGLVPLISKIIDRNMFAQDSDPVQYGWRWFRDWNGYGARNTTAYINGTRNDCDIVDGAADTYRTALNSVNQHSKYN
jgi:hypothetical protein